MTAEERATRLLAFARELQRAATFEELLRTTQTEIADAIGYAHTWLMVADSDQADEWRLIDAAGANRAEIWKHAVRLKVHDDAMMEEIARSESPVVVVDARTDPRTNKAIVAQLGNRTIINVALRLVDGLFGAFGTGTFGDEGCRAPTPEDLDHLVAMANQVAGAAARLRLLEERTITNEALRRSEEDLRITLHSIGDAVIATSAAGRVTRMNPVAEQLTGWSFADALERPIADVFHIINEDTRQIVESPVERVLREGVVVGLANHTLLVARDGKERAIADSGAPIRDAQGRLCGVVLVFRDQTDERNAERRVREAAARLEAANEALRKSETRFRRLTESGILGIIISDPSGRLWEANDAFLATVGYTAEDLRAGIVTSQTLNAKAREGADATPRAELLTRGATRPWEKELLRKDGSRVPVMIGAANVDEASGETISFVLDLTEQRRAEAAERESEARKTAVMEAALDAIVLMDDDGLITDFNEAAERMFGYARAEVIGRPLAHVLIPPAQRAHHRAGLERYLATGEQAILGKRVEVSALRRNGSEFPAEVAIVRIRSEGRPVFTGYIRDISERRRAAEAELLRREKESAERANAELEAFSYSVAHDLRAPLRGINGFSAILLEDHADKLDADAQALLRRVTTSAERMGHIIDALLSLARLSQGELRCETFDLAAMARAVIDQLRATDPGRVVELVAPDSLMAHGDPALLRAALENLLGNAWKFTKHQARAQIEVGVTNRAGPRWFYVRDNGAGFDMKYAERLFAPFQRLHTSAEFEGTGVGLATVARIIRRHGGRVKAEGRVNEGATFEFTLTEEPSTGAVS